jgi:hypothetical protein
LDIREWIDHIDKHEMSYNAGFKSDKDFGAKILGLTDLTFFQFYESGDVCVPPEITASCVYLSGGMWTSILDECGGIGSLSPIFEEGRRIRAHEILNLKLGIHNVL